MLFIFLIMVFSEATAGGPWVLGKKKAYFQLQTTLPLGSYARLFHRDGIEKDIYLNRKVIDSHFQAYLEYGLTDKLTLISTLPFKYVATSDELESNRKIEFNEQLESGSLAALANASIGLKHQLFNGKWIGAISAKYEFNSSSQDLEKGLSTGFQAGAISSFIHIGRSFPKDTYFFIETGGTMRGNDYSDEVEVITELGKKIKSVWTALVLDYKKSLRNGSRVNPLLDQTGLYTNNQEFFAFGVKIAKDLNNNNGINFSTFGAFSGHKVAHLATVNIGWYKKW